MLTRFALPYMQDVIFCLDVMFVSSWSVVVLAMVVIGVRVHVPARIAVQQGQ
jgi:hypothetical protein